MKPRSEISFPLFKFDVPEPKEIDGIFKYNYFIKDERVSTDPRSDPAALSRHNNEPARRVVLTFNPLRDITELLPYDTSESQRLSDQQEFYNLITSEVSMQGSQYQFVSLQDENIVGELVDFLREQLVFQKAESRGLSPMEAVLKYSSIPGTPDAEDILSMPTLDSENVTYFDPATGEDLSVLKEGGVPRQSVGIQLNKKFCYDILNRSENTPFSPLWGKIDPTLATALSVQSEAVITLDSSEFNSNNFQFNGQPLPSVGLPMAPGGVPKEPYVNGYLIEKFEVTPSGDRILIDKFHVVNVDRSDYEDTEVSYGKTYSYRIKTVFSVFLSSGTPLGSQYLVSSRGAPFIDVACIETVPPPPPQNLEFFITPDLDAMIFWEMPFNTQEDIKRFQIFRRSSLHEPFTLLSEIDFDDSLVLTTRKEFVPEFTNIKKDSVTTSFVDEDFDLDKNYIYAICSVDAHDLSSPYSNQYEVNYSRIYGKMMSKVLAFAGAPKQYPNFTLKGAGVLPCIKDSGHKQMRVYFAPDTVVLKGFEQIDSTGVRIETRERFLETNASGEPIFKIQIINLDWQQSEVVNIGLKNEAAEYGLFAYIRDNIEGT